MNNVKRWQAEWVRNNYPSPQFQAISENLRTQWGEQHWSRLWEYPWVLINGGFQQGMNVLDAAGGDAKLQALLAMLGCNVLNVDNDPPALERAKQFYKDKPLFHNVNHVVGDIATWQGQVGDLRNFYDRVICVSVLEHTQEWHHVLHNLWGLVKPSGKLLITMDVAGYARANHTVTLDKAKEICGGLGVTVPPFPNDLLTMKFDELEPTPIEPKQVELAVLCWLVEKE